MRITRLPATLLLAITLAACSGVEIEPSETGTFAAGNYRYYKWRSEPLVNTSNSNDPIYLVDPVMRREVNAALRRKGYIEDPSRARFSVDYLYATALREGATSEQASNITPYPSVTPNRQVNQAIVDNAQALGGPQETSNIAVQFNDTQSNAQVWRVVITKVVENVNSVDTARLSEAVNKALEKAMRELPEAS